MRVLVVTTVHTPLDARIHHRQIRAMRRAGWQVSYAAPWADTDTPLEAVVAGVAPIELPRAVGRHRLRALCRARRVIRVLGPAHDLVLLHDPELLLAVAGRLDRSPPVVLDVHEDLAASLADRAWIPGWLRAPAHRLAVLLEGWAEQHLTLLLAEEGYRERFRGDHPVIPNLPWLPAAAAPAGTHNRVVYVGRLSAGRGVDELIAVAQRLRAAEGPHLHLVGPADAGVESAVQTAADQGTLVWHGFLPNDRALEVVTGSLAGLSLLHDLPNYRVSLPTKLVEYLAHGVPVITTPLPAATAFLDEVPGGIVVPFGDVAAVVDAVLELARDPDRARVLGATGRSGVQRRASWDAVSSRFLTTLEEAAGHAGHGQAGR